MKELLCYTFVKGNKPGERIGIVKYGETGYYLTDFDRPSMSAEEVAAFVADRNNRMEIPEDVAESMQFASCFGWNVPIADKAHAYYTSMKNQD